MRVMTSRRSTGCSALLFCLLALPQGLRANDGRDRTAGGVPNLFSLFPDPLSVLAGYQILSQDAPGGADGDRAFRWARKEAIALVRLAAYETARVWKPAPFPMTIFDLSAENGDTPVTFSPRLPPMGRHPGGSHDGGINLDLGYFLTSLKGASEPVDFAACTQHHRQGGKDGKAEDVNVCQGPADRLDVDRESFFLLQLFRVNREFFGSALLENIGIDTQVRKAIMAKMQEWVQAKQHGATAELLDDMKQVFISDRWEGWERFHHHHVHVRLQDLPWTGKNAASFESLLAKERELDRILVGNDKPALRARVMSAQLRRSVELEWLGSCPDGQARFRLAAQDWQEADPSSAPRLRAVLDLPAELNESESDLLLEGEMTCPGQPRIQGKTKVILPRREPWLFISIDPGRIEGLYQKKGNRWTLYVRMPEVYRHLVTDVSYLLYRTGVAREATLKSDPRNQQASFVETAKTPAARLILARVTLSSRMKLDIPVYCPPSGSAFAPGVVAKR